jgi:hypothetical protein
LPMATRPSPPAIPGNKTQLTKTSHSSKARQIPHPHLDWLPWLAVCPLASLVPNNQLISPRGRIKTSAPMRSRRMLLTKIQARTSRVKALLVVNPLRLGSSFHLWMVAEELVEQIKLLIDGHRRRMTATHPVQGREHIDLTLQRCQADPDQR